MVLKHLDQKSNYLGYTKSEQSLKEMVPLLEGRETLVSRFSTQTEEGTTLKTEEHGSAA